MNYSSNDKCGYKGKKKKYDRERERKYKQERKSVGAGCKLLLLSTFIDFVVNINISFFAVNASLSFLRCHLRIRYSVMSAYVAS
jgi:hypothetical protein